MAHSPEPWELIPDEDGDENRMSILDADGARVAWVYGSRNGIFGHTDPATLLANANILLAAPELLEACRANLEFQQGSLSSIDDIVELAEKCKRLTAAAIAKATGGTS